MQTETIIYILLALAPITIFYFYKYHNKEKRRIKIEKELVKKLYRLSSLIDVVDFDSIFSRVKDRTVLGKEFEKINNEILSGKSTIKSLQDSKEKMNNKFYSNAIDILINIYITGSDGSEIIMRLAEKIVQEKLIEKEKQTNLLIQKYTLISAIFIVPIILGSMLSIISSLDFSLLSESSFNSNEVSLTANLIYVVINSVLISLFLGKLENLNFKILLYCIIFVPISFILFTYASQGFFTSIIS